MSKINNVQVKIIAGNSVQMYGSAPFSTTDRQDACHVRGKAKNGQDVDLLLPPGLISRHLMILGSVGTGKTNAFYSLMNYIKPRLKSEDVMIVFDTKGDFLKYYHPKRDAVISVRDIVDYPDVTRWNLFSELDLAESFDDEAMEISKMLFDDAIKRNSSNPFFPKAASELLAALLQAIRNREKISGLQGTNHYLAHILRTLSITEFYQFLEASINNKGVLSYISSNAKAQAEGVFAELKQTALPLLVGNFAEKKADFSVRKFVRNKGGRALFIEYDLGLGNTLTPLYKLLYDLAIKESLCRDRSLGNVYFIVDEFSLLPRLKHIADGINFGRSLGAKFILGLQSVSQMYEEYGEHQARSILSGLSTLLSFRLNDHVSREYVSSYLGENLKQYSYQSQVQARGTVEAPLQRGRVVEEWVIQRLQPGEAIIAFPEKPPFVFRFPLTEPVF